MSKVTYSKGPWEVGYASNESIETSTLAVWQKDVLDSGSGSVICKVSPEKTMNEQDYANALLIAAAPDLLEALLLARENILDTAILEKINAAITKAVGEYDFVLKFSRQEDIQADLKEQQDHTQYIASLKGTPKPDIALFDTDFGTDESYHEHLRIWNYANSPVKIHLASIEKEMYGTEEMYIGDRKLGDINDDELYQLTEVERQAVWDTFKIILMAGLPEDKAKWGAPIYDQEKMADIKDISVLVHCRALYLFYTYTQGVDFPTTWAIQETPTGYKTIAGNTVYTAPHFGLCVRQLNDQFFNY